MTNKFDFKKPMIIIDLEMTGLDPSKHQIIEIAAFWCDPVTLEEIDRFHTMVGPPVGRTLDEIAGEADPIAMSINGIDLEDLRRAPSPAEAMNMLQDWLPGKTYEVQWAGHGVATDYLFLEKAIRRASSRYNLDKIPYDFIDTKPLVKFLFCNEEVERKYGFLGNSSLVNACVNLAIPRKGAHRADNDVEMCRKVLKKLCYIVDNLNSE